MTGPAPILDPVDGLLGVFDPDADGKGLRFNGRSLVPEASRTSPRRCDRGPKSTCPSVFLRTVDDIPTSLPPGMVKSVACVLKTDFAAPLQVTAPQVHHDLPQSVRPDVGTGDRSGCRRGPRDRPCSS